MGTCEKACWSVDCKSGLSHYDILIKYLETFVELSAPQDESKNIDREIAFMHKATRQAIHPLNVEVSWFIYSANFAHLNQHKYLLLYIISICKLPVVQSK